MDGLVTKQTLNETDFLEIRELEDKCSKHDGFEVKLNWDMLQHRRVDETADFCFYRADQLVGYAPLDAFGDAFELTGMVDPDYRSQGIFHRLFEAAKTEAQRRQARQLLLVSYRAGATGTEIARHLGQYQSSEYRMSAEAATMPSLPSTNLQLFEVGSTELPELSRLLGLAFGSARWNSVEELSHQTGLPNSRYWLANLDGRSIGQIRAINEESKVYIRSVGIDPAYRGRGYGRELLAATLNKLLNEGSIHFELDVTTQNETALSLYQSCGFQTNNIYDYYQIDL